MMYFEGLKFYIILQKEYNNASFIDFLKSLAFLIRYKIRR